MVRKNYGLLWAIVFACFPLRGGLLADEPSAMALKPGIHSFADNQLVDRAEGVQRLETKLSKDRSVARQAGSQIGLLVTPWITTDADQITLNCDANKGEIRVQVVDEKDWMVYGLAFGDCKPIKVDSHNAPVEWDRPMSLVHGKKIRLQFSIRNASLYGFELTNDSKPN